MEMHLVDRRNQTEAVYCGENASDDARMGVDYYLEQRKHGFGVGTVCEECKVSAITFAMNLARKLEDQGLVDEANEYWELARTLVGETGQNPPGDWRGH